MSGKKSRVRALLLLPAAVLSLLTVLFLAGIIKSLPQRAADQFGPPDPALGTVQLYYLSLKLSLQSDSLTSPSAPGSKSVELEIIPGESIDDILRKLSAAGLISDRPSLRNYLVYSGADRRVQTGLYRFETDLSPLEIAHRLQDHTPHQTILTILPGWRVEEVAETFPEIGLTLSSAEFIQLVKEESREGFLFPGSYQVNRDIKADDLLDTLVDSFYDHLAGSHLEGFNRQGLTIPEAVTLASIVEREAVMEEEMPLIASVFLNRLQLGMRLEADPTVQYARGYHPSQGSWWTNPLSGEDLTIDSPYNTYLSSGLPPGPICNPGGKALDAVAQPAETDYYFFRAACNGSGRHIFSKDYQSHLEAACP